MIDKQKDEFIVDCINNTVSERQEVYKFLVENRNYDKGYSTDNYPVIVCRIKGGDSNYSSLISAKKYTNFPVYAFKQFKEMYLDENTMQENNKKIIKYIVQETIWGYKGIKWIKGDFLWVSNTKFLLYFKELGLLNNPKFFTPVYEEEIQTINMGSFNLTVKDKKVFHNGSEDITDFVKDMNNTFNKLHNLGKYTARIEDIVFASVGCECGSNTKLSDWLKVYDMIK